MDRRVRGSKRPRELIGINALRDMRSYSWTALKTASLILRRRVAPSRRTLAATISLVAILRDADLRSAPQDEADGEVGSSGGG
jgi:hypothetical protein